MPYRIGALLWTTLPHIAVYVVTEAAGGNGASLQRPYYAGRGSYAGVTVITQLTGMEDSDDNPYYERNTTNSASCHPPAAAVVTLMLTRIVCPNCGHIGVTTALLPRVLTCSQCGQRRAHQERQAGEISDRHAGRAGTCLI